MAKWDYNNVWVCNICMVFGMSDCTELFKLVSKHNFTRANFCKYLSRVDCSLVQSIVTKSTCIMLLLPRFPANFWQTVCCWSNVHCIVSQWRTGEYGGCRSPTPCGGGGSVEGGLAPPHDPWVIHKFLRGVYLEGGGEIQRRINALSLLISERI